MNSSCRRCHTTWITLVPLRREGMPEDVSGAVVFLASDYCRYMTGQLLVVDGGVTSTF